MYKGYRGTFNSSEYDLKTAYESKFGGSALKVDLKIQASDILCVKKDYERGLDGKDKVSVYLHSGCPYVAGGFTLEAVGVLGLAAATTVLAAVMFFGDQKLIIQGGLSFAIGLFALIGGALILISASNSETNLVNAMKTRQFIVTLGNSPGFDPAYYYTPSEKPTADNTALYDKVAPMVKECTAKKTAAALAITAAATKSLKEKWQKQAALARLTKDCELARKLMEEADGDRYMKYVEAEVQAGTWTGPVVVPGGVLLPLSPDEFHPRLPDLSSYRFDERALTTYKELSKAKDKSDAGVIGIVAGLLFAVLGGHMLFTAIRGRNKKSVDPTSESQVSGELTTQDDTPQQPAQA